MHVTLGYAIFHGNLKLAFIYTNNDILRSVKILYTKAQHFTKSKTIHIMFYIQKSSHFALRNFSLNFLNWWRGGTFLYETIMHFSLNFYMKKQCT